MTRMAVVGGLVLLSAITRKTGLTAAQRNSLLGRLVCRLQS
jgi:hypothetical protein